MYMTARVKRGAADLVLKEKSPKGPDGTEHKEELVDFFASVCWCVVRREQGLQ